MSEIPGPGDPTQKDVSQPSTQEVKQAQSADVYGLFRRVSRESRAAANSGEGYLSPEEAERLTEQWRAEREQKLLEETLAETGWNPGSLSTITDSPEKLQLYSKYGREWKKFLTDLPSATEAYNRIRIYENVARSLKDLEISVIDKLMPAILETYDYIYSNKTLMPPIKKKVADLGEAMAVKFHDPEEVRRLVALMREVDTLEDANALSSFVNCIDNYGRQHGLSADTIEGFRTKLLPAIQRRDPQVALLIRGGTAFGFGDSGAGNFIMHGYAKRVNPGNLNDLLLHSREVPTTEISKLEQNRLDGLASGFPSLRDLVHDQRPLVHEVVSGMVEYYETKNREKLASILKRAEYLAPLADDPSYPYYNISNYEASREETLITGEQRQVKEIDILRRLVENTRVVTSAAPATNSTEVNEWLGTVETAWSRQAQEIPLLERSKNIVEARKALGYALDTLNKELYSMMERHEVGIEPNMILAINWLGQRAFEALQDLSYEDQLNTYAEPWFQALVTFEELTYSPDDFDLEEFRTFTQQVREAGSGIKPYKLVADRLVGHVRVLMTKYQAAGQDRRMGALWSGNVIHELMTLAGTWREPNDLSTQAGRRHYENRLAGRTGD